MEPISDREIFVAIVCYRDPECQHTIRDLFSKAARPERVSVGVLWQCDRTRDADCFVVQTRPGQVRGVVIHPSEARGPCWARSRVQEFWRGEPYIMQIDSHMRFCPAWDERALEMLGDCASDRPILTTYPPPYWLPDRLSDDPRPRLLRARRFHDDRILRVRSAILNGRFRHPIRSAFWGAGFHFSSSAAFQQVPYDPFLAFLFFGEEIAMTVRFWTSGFDFFAPQQHLVYHLYSRQHRPVFWEHRDQCWKRPLEIAQQRVRYLVGTATLGVPEECLTEFGRYGLGAARPLAEYERFSGVDFRRLLLSERAVYGGFPRTLVQPV
jgi:glycosyltransferase involved in cell wall biosynthesis